MVQFLIVSAVVMSNVHWHWTPNAYLAGILGVLAAFIVTIAWIYLLDLTALLRRRGEKQHARDLRADPGAGQHWRG